MEPIELRRRLQGDLDTIVMKAIRWEPEERYASAEEFAQDIERHLAGLPIKARKPTLLYRGWKVRSPAYGVVGHGHTHPRRGSGFGGLGSALAVETEAGHRADAWRCSSSHPSLDRNLGFQESLCPARDRLGFNCACRRC